MAAIKQLLFKPREFASQVRKGDEDSDEEHGDNKKKQKQEQSNFDKMHAALVNRSRLHQNGYISAHEIDMFFQEKRRQIINQKEEQKQ